MADPSESTHPLENLRSGPEPSSCWTGASSEAAYVTASASERESSIPSSSTTFFPAHSEFMSSESMSSERRKAESGKGDDMSVEDAIERSKVHWSQLTTEHDESDEEEDEVAEVSNVEVFRSLLMHATRGDFFSTFGDGGIYDVGELEVGEKFAEGAQAEIYHAHITWKDPHVALDVEERGYKHVLKVFRKGTFLRDLQKQWPQGLFQYREEVIELLKHGGSLPKRYISDIFCGTLLQDGRFAFLMLRENEDLRTLIDRCMKARVCIDFGPFSRETMLAIMVIIARGMAKLHDLNIVHRDLKASNVLCSRLVKKMDTYVWDYNVASVELAILDDFYFCVADFECSIGVVETGFFRAPEILQALKDKASMKNPNPFTKEADVYSYGMLCYEILTGKLPFEGHCTTDYDLVLKGSRPEVPHYVENWARDLLCKCWQSNPSTRPTFRQILDLFDKADEKLKST